MSLNSIHSSVAQRWTDVTYGLSMPTLGQDTETPVKYRRGSFNYDQVNGILSLEWLNLEALDMWCWNEEFAHSIELIKSTINACSSQVWTLRCLFVCLCEDGRGCYCDLWVLGWSIRVAVPAPGSGLDVPCLCLLWRSQGKICGREAIFFLSLHSFSAVP